MVGLDFHAFFSLDNGHLRIALEQFRQDGLVRGIEVRYQHETHAAVRGHVGKKLFESLEASG